MSRAVALGLLALLGCGTRPAGDGGVNVHDAGISWDGGNLHDAGADDAGFFGPSRCADAGLALCEDFETPGALDAGRWTRNVFHGQLGVDSVHAARGAFALHVHVPNMVSSYALLSNRTLFADGGFPDNHYFGRAFLWLEPAATGSHNAFITSRGPILYSDGGVSLSTAWYGVHEHGRNFASSYGLTGPPDAGKCDCGFISTTPVADHRWVCLEWEFDGSANTLHAWADEQELGGLEVAASRGYQAPRFDSIDIGLNMSHTEPDGGDAYDLWYDEIAIDGQRIGCQR